MKAIDVLIILILCNPALAMTLDEFNVFQAWMTTDQTDLAEYVNITHDCLAFSQDFKKNATNAGYVVYMANVQSPEYAEGHFINAVEVNGEYHFIEPQGDVELDLTGARILIFDDNAAIDREISGKNEIVVSGNALIPVKA